MEGVACCLDDGSEASRRNRGAAGDVGNGGNYSATAFHSRAPVRRTTVLVDHTKPTSPVDCSVQILHSISSLPLHRSVDIADSPSSAARSACGLRRSRFVERRGCVEHSDLQFAANLDQSDLAAIATDDTAEPMQHRACQYRTAANTTTTRDASFETHRELIRSTIRRTRRSRRIEPRRLPTDITVRTSFLLLRPTRSLPRSRRRIFDSSFRICRRHPRRRRSVPTTLPTPTSRRWRRSREGGRRSLRLLLRRLWDSLRCGEG